MSELTEKFFRAMNRAMQGREFKDEAEMRAFGDVLEAFLLGDLDRAAEARILAREENGHLEAYLLGYRKLPKRLPVSYTWRSPEQAACAASHLIPAWLAHPESLRWLKAVR